MVKPQARNSIGTPKTGMGSMRIDGEAWEEVEREGPKGLGNELKGDDTELGAGSAHPRAGMRRTGYRRRPGSTRPESRAHPQSAFRAPYVTHLTSEAPPPL